MRCFSAQGLGLWLPGEGRHSPPRPGLLPAPPCLPGIRATGATGSPGNLLQTRGASGPWLTSSFSFAPMQTLKVIRYASRLVLAGTSVQATLPGIGKKLGSLESSIGTTRKALKLGKFLQGVQEVRDIKPGSENALLELVAVVSDTSYLFCEQLQW